VILRLPFVLNPDEASAMVAQLQSRTPTDGALTAGAARAVKRNREVLDADLRQQLSSAISQALQRNPSFLGAAVPKAIYPFIFNCYHPGMAYGGHLDEAIMGRGAGQLRADLSLTLFLSDPASYDGGELVVDSDSARVPIKLPQGDAVLYPSSAIHEVAAVTRGTRWAAVTWIQSLVRRIDQRDVVWQIAQLSDELRRLQVSDTTRELKETLERRLLGVRANLLRMWSEP
jgi:PKHD-type hydroxylase